MVGSALLPIAAMAAMAFFVWRWAGDELEREGRLSEGAGNAVAALALFHTFAVVLAVLGAELELGLPLVPALVIGIPAGVAGVVLVIGAARALRSREAVLGTRVERLVTHGPYRRLRHPFFVGWTLALGGVALGGRSGLALALVAVLVIVLIVVARGEDRRLAARHGEDYATYRAGTPAVWRPRRRGRPATLAA
jgi:protein-S-isoprenylcysteine O-methyltransferase Ste14